MEQFTPFLEKLTPLKRRINMSLLGKGADIKVPNLYQKFYRGAMLTEEQMYLFIEGLKELRDDINYVVSDRKEKEFVPFMEKLAILRKRVVLVNIARKSGLKIPTMHLRFKAGEMTEKQKFIFIEELRKLRDEISDLLAEYSKK